MDTLTPAEAAQLLGTSPNRVRQLLRDRKLMAVPGSGNGKIPADFLQDGAILKHLPGLLTVLADGVSRVLVGLPARAAGTGAAAR